MEAALREAGWAREQIDDALGAFVVIGDLISLIYNLPSGELTPRFLLKSTIVAALAGSIFGYYFWTMKADDEALAR